MEKRASRRMKKNTVLWTAILFFCLTLNIVHAEQPTVVLQVNESSPIWSAQFPLGGMGGEIVQAISKEMGMKTRIEFIPLKRLIADTTNNDIGNPLFYMDNQAFEEIIPIAVSYSAFFTYDNDVENVLSEIDAKTKRIGVLQGTLTDFTASKSFGSFEKSTSQESLFKKLKAGRLGLVLTLNLVGLETIKHLFPNEFERFDVKVISNSGSPIAIMIDSNYPNANAIGLRYQEGLDRILKNGVYQKILEKYHEKDSIPTNWHTDLLKFKAIYSMNFDGNNL